MTTTTADLEARLKATPYAYTYEGISVFELGEDGEWLVAVGHVDKDAFAAALDGYYREVREESILDGYYGAVTTFSDIAADAKHQKAQIINLEEFPLGEFGLQFGSEGDIDVTTLAVG
jgi:hypothetical protein